MENMHTDARFKGLIPCISLEQFFIENSMESMRTDVRL